MRKGSPNAAAIEIEDAMVLTARKNHTTAEGITALRADQAGLQSPSLSSFCKNEGWNFLPQRRSSHTWRMVLISSDKTCASILTENCSSSLPEKTLRRFWEESVEPSKLRSACPPPI